jgi:hypothetical protein
MTPRRHIQHNKRAGTPASNRGVLLWKGKLNRKYLIHFAIPLSSTLFLSGCTPASLLPSPWTLAAPVVLALLSAAGIIALTKSGKIPAIKDLLPDPKFSEANITHTFIAALPTLTREMNLEVASSKQTEVLERSDARRFLWALTWEPTWRG